MAYSPQPELAQRIAAALELPQFPDTAAPRMGRDQTPIAVLLSALQDELPPRWLREVERVADELSRGVQLAVVV